jgi:prophage DNA circulation protein
VLAGDPPAAARAWQAAFATVTDPADLRTIASTLEPLFVESGGGSLDTLNYLSALSAAAAAAAGATYSTWDDAIAIRDELARQMDGAALYLTDADPHAALLDLKGATVAAISDEAMRLPRLRPLSVMRPVPALALAFDLYGDADRAVEIVTRNNVSDPSAVAGNLRVLTA